MRQIISMILLVVFGLMLLIFPLVHTSVSTLASSFFYKDILQSDMFKNEVAKKMSFGGRLQRVAQIDKKLYYQVSAYAKQELTGRYMKELGKKWLDFIQGRVDKFDSVINIQPLKSTIYYQVMRRVKQKYAIYPALLRKSIEKETVRRFACFPSKINIFQRLKVSKATEGKINRRGQQFASVYKLRLLLFLAPLVILVLMIVISKMRLFMLYAISFVGIGTNVTFLILSYVFKGFIIDLSYNSLGYIGIGMTKFKPYFNLFWDAFFSHLAAVAWVTILILVAILVPLFIKDKKREG